MALIALRDVTLAFRGPPVLDAVNLTIEPRERICLLGRNGTGKTSLLRVLHGTAEADRGEIARQQGLVTALLPQEVPQDLSGTVFDEVARHTECAYYKGGHRGVEPLARHQVEAAISRMGLDAAADVAVLSAGMKRRVLLAKALVREPDLLLLDEPTNHLDIDAIGWLEEFLLRYGGTLLFVTHDRVFLRKLATRIIEIDRGRLTTGPATTTRSSSARRPRWRPRPSSGPSSTRSWPRKRSGSAQGIKARRTRNEGRVRALREAARDPPASAATQPGEVRMEIQEAERSGRLVIEAEERRRSPTANGRSSAISRRRSCAATRSASSAPTARARPRCCGCCWASCRRTAGTIRHGTNLQIAYFDQLHAQLDEDKIGPRERRATAPTTVDDRRQAAARDRLPQDFLFTPERRRRPVARLSGGERNRLLLAKLFTKPSNVLVLDEPTNDLDIETLELLEELLVEYPGHAAAGQPRPRVPQQRGHQHAGVRRRRPRQGVRRRLRRLAAAACGRRPACRP